MASFIISGKRIDLSAVVLDPKASTRVPEAWLGRQYMTLRLLAPVTGIRVHTNGKAFPGRPASNAQGAWVALGDVIQTAGELQDTRSLPGFFTHIGEATLCEQCIVNVGPCAGLLGGVGGGFQAEYIAGPAVRFEPLRGRSWHARAGHA